jgi:hypothetical protein
MSLLALSTFLSGAFMMGLAIAGLFFLQFWKTTRDKIFLFFSIGFWLMAIERIPLVFFHPAKEHESYVYLIRLLAFLLIIYAIVVKNRESSTKGSRGEATKNK